MPISARKSRGVIRLYWVGDDENASERFGREFSMAMARDIHSEDRAVIEAGQRGLNSGALKHIHLQSQEVLIRHLIHNVNAKVQAYKAERACAGERNERSGNVTAGWVRSVDAVRAILGGRYGGRARALPGCQR